MFCVDVLMRYKRGLRTKVLSFVFVVSWLTTETTLVSGLNFTLSKTQVVLGTNGKLFMTCDVTETDASSVYNVQIRREVSTGWETLAYIETGMDETPALNSDIVNDRDFGVGGNLDKETALNTHLSLEMNIEKMTYGDAKIYRCEMAYKSKFNGSTVNIYRKTKLLIIEADNETVVRAEADNKTEVRAEADNKTEVRADNTQKSSKSDNGNSALTVGAILGVTNILTVVYAAYLTVVIRRSRIRSFDDGNSCHGRHEPCQTGSGS